MSKLTTLLLQELEAEKTSTKAGIGWISSLTVIPMAMLGFD